jgi:hypothetical protein
MLDRKRKKTRMSYQIPPPDQAKIVSRGHGTPGQLPAVSGDLLAGSGFENEPWESDFDEGGDDDA